MCAVSILSKNSSHERFSSSSSIISQNTSDVQAQPKRVVVALTGGSHEKAAIDEAITLAKANSAIVVGITIIDAKRLDNVGFVPVGGSYYAATLRHKLTEKANQDLEVIVSYFEEAAQKAKIPYTIVKPNGKPVKILRDFERRDDVIMVDHFRGSLPETSQQKTNPLSFLNRKNLFPLFCRKNNIRDNSIDASGKF